MKAMLWIFFALFMVSIANADEGVYGYGYWMPIYAKDYLKVVDNNSPSKGPAKCESVYTKAINKGVLDIRYALGYFDDSTGEERFWKGINFGMSPSLDIDVYESIRKVLTARCWDRSLKTCGFSESGDARKGKSVFQKYIDLHGKKTLVRLTLVHGSATKSYVLNKGAEASLQKAITAQAEDVYFNGLKQADIVLYNGHSRNGGGPDFNPPILNSHNKVNYKGYYEIKRPGILRVMKSLKENPNKDIIVGLFSCYSKKHFYDTFMQANPRQRVILSAETINYVDAYKASIGYLEGFLRGSCGQELADTAKKEEKLYNGFQGYNIN